MIALSSKQDASPYTVVEHIASQDGRFGWFLAIWHPEKDPILQEIGAEIRLAIRNSQAATISKMEVEKWMRVFFNDLHWKIFSILRKSNLKERGLSLFFGVVYDHELFFVQYGRLFCAMSDGKKLLPQGRNYRDYLMQSLEKLNLFGYAERDISTKVQRVFIGENHRFIVLSGNLVAKVFTKDRDLNTLDHYVESFAQSDHPLWLILEGKSKLIKPKRKKISRVQISSIILIVLTIITILYMLFGNRFIDQMLQRTRMNVKHTRTLRLDQIPNTLAIDTQNMIKYMERIVNLPARNIELDVLWNASLPYSVTLAPVFSLDTIFLAADKNLLAFDKKTRNLKWKKSFDASINSLLYADNVLLVCVQSDSAFAFSDSGERIWQKQLFCPQNEGYTLFTSRIGKEDDPRLDRAITVVPSNKNISIVDAYRGEILSSITFRENIHSLSAYDNYANQFYAVVDDALLCIQLKIAN